MEHEVTLTSELKPWILAQKQILRGPYVSRFLRPDATVLLGTEVIHFENDEDTEQPHVLQKKVDRYLSLVSENATQTLIWIAPSEKRLNLIKEITKPIASLCLYKTAGSTTVSDTNGVTLDVTELL